MQSKDKVVKSAITAILTLTAMTVASPDALAEQLTEKCYGIVKMGMNDCKTATDCAAASKEDKQSDAFIFLPIDLCEKIKGGKLDPA
jgi:uncharacterized membrane protein